LIDEELFSNYATLHKYLPILQVSTGLVRNMKNRRLSWLTSVAIILLLVLAGPAQGFTLNLLVNFTEPEQGNTITFTAEIDIGQGERLPIDYLTLTIDGGEKQLCEFTPDGKIKQTCKGLISIERISSTTYGYGYNYGYSCGYGYNFGYDYGYGYSGASSS